MDKERLKATALDDDELLKILVPGNSEATIKVRSEILRFAGNAAARGVLIIGPVGAGKSTIARVIALMRFLNFCSDERRQIVVQHLAFDGPFRIDKKFLNWFEELNLTGLTDELAQAQLFGVAKGAATGVSERAGIFEQAMTGHAGKDKMTDAARITGGVVFLDEIGDFSLRLQPLLLLLLTGTEVFRVGGEGNPDYGYRYNGITMAATWKDPFDGCLRPDLISRLGNYIIRIPSLNERKDEFEEIVGAIISDIIDNHREYLDRLDRESPELVSRSKIKIERNRSLELKNRDVEFLGEQDWTVRGDLRGLRQTLERCFYEGISVADAIEFLAHIEYRTKKPVGNITRQVVEEICQGKHQTTLAREIKRIEKNLRIQLVSTLNSEPDTKRHLAERLNVDIRDLKKQLNDLTRDRVSNKNEDF